MKKIKKLALLLAICMVGTVGLVGCGNDGDSSSKNENSASQTADDNANSADDGTFSGEMSGVTVSGNYTFEGTDLVMTVGEQKFNYTYDADNDMLKYTDPNTGLSSYCERQQ